MLPKSLLCYNDRLIDGQRGEYQTRGIWLFFLFFLLFSQSTLIIVYWLLATIQFEINSLSHKIISGLLQYEITCITNISKTYPYEGPLLCQNHFDDYLFLLSGFP